MIISRRNIRKALSSYERFFSRRPMRKRINPEIEKVKLRLPSLKRQIQLGQGA